MEDDYEDTRSVLHLAMDTVLQPARSTLTTLTSKTARRAYLTTLLIFLTSLLLLGTAVVAYITFYYAYVPLRGFSTPIHLQFDPLAQTHPHATAPLGDVLVAHQKYDVRLNLRMPRTPANLRAGNFMLDVRLLAPGLAGPLDTVVRAAAAAVAGDEGPDDVVVRSSRAAILEYRSWAMEVRERVVWGLWYVAGWRREEEEVSVRMLEDVVFEKGVRGLPRWVRVDVRGREVLQVYECEIVFRARLSGLRYIMYNHRIISFITFTSLFYAIELTSLLISWALLSLLFPSSSKPKPPPKSPKREIKPDDDDPAIKLEHDHDHDHDSDSAESTTLSTTSRSFPTYTRQPPLHYSSPPPIKKEEDPEDSSGDLSALPLAAGEAADDEDDDDEADDFVLDEDENLRRIAADSGLGTSLESSGGGGGGVRRRRSGGGLGR
ncbi:hypothetical protein EJ05DRAFT_473528 [Pseudovirgaria hyperparasitica]|uniref:DUF1226-domain-containing protein n=1 Tax=Pseudovirgaria hyperparasitica TaxID=470096 RepID=A0A6A6WEJ1_9PEZI|nr:uncharacterized protein EJ05DRAFT_473528 [Pseudovirgaria hyperparasitica]KAF2760955.1 hypothetical protein EJ05DRAFT_473528 [Pseudovirgaria hyperparasitica]